MRRYQPPGARVGDVLPEAPGPIPDWAAVIVGVAVEYFLSVYVANALAIFFAAGIAGDEQVDTSLSLILDLAFTCCGQLFAFWIALDLCRSRSFWVPTIVAALCWLIMFADRWVIEEYGYPLWYESALLFTHALALATLYARARGLQGWTTWPSRWR